MFFKFVMELEESCEARGSSTVLGERESEIQLLDSIGHPTKKPY